VRKETGLRVRRPRKARPLHEKSKYKGGNKARGMDGTHGRKGRWVKRNFFGGQTPASCGKATKMSHFVRGKLIVDADFRAIAEVRTWGKKQPQRGGGKSAPSGASQCLPLQMRAQPVYHPGLIHRKYKAHCVAPGKEVPRVPPFAAPTSAGGNCKLLVLQQRGPKRRHPRFPASKKGRDDQPVVKS